jgi:homoaconitase/3-isopropylmalate dehydratase large subunit
MLVAGYNGSKGGTQHTFSYAIEKGVNIIHINPDTKTIRYIKNRKDGN